MLDGRPVQVPTPVMVRVSPGVHEVQLIKPGYQPVVRQVEVYSSIAFASFSLTPAKPAPGGNEALKAARKIQTLRNEESSSSPKSSSSMRYQSPEPGNAGKTAAKPRQAPSVKIAYRRSASAPRESWVLLPEDNPFSRHIQKKKPQKGSVSGDKPGNEPSRTVEAASAADQEPGDEKSDDSLEEKPDIFPLVIKESEKNHNKPRSPLSLFHGEPEEKKSPPSGEKTATETKNPRQIKTASLVSVSDRAAKNPRSYSAAPARPREQKQEAPPPESSEKGMTAQAGFLNELHSSPAREQESANPKPGGEDFPLPEVEWPKSAEDLLYEAAAELPRFPEKMNILLLGLDRRDARGILATGRPYTPEELKRKPANADVIMVAQLDFSEMQIRLVSIPRDTRVRIPGVRGWRKINASYAYGREKKAIRVVEDFLRIPIHRHVVVDWRGAKKAISLFKSLGLDYMGFSEKEMFWHLRKRSFPRGDFRRIERQQRFLRYALGEYLRLFNQVRSAEGAASAVKRTMLEMAVKQGLSVVDTDFTFQEVMLLSHAFRNYRPEKMLMTQVPGQGRLVGAEDGEGGVYFFIPVSRHSFDELVERAEEKAGLARR